MALSDPPRRRSPRGWRRGDRVAVLVLLAVPLVLFVVPALAGHPAVAGDNLLQNYPLRVLAGSELRAGHWPLWNPYADSGTPLLGGMNAGALYPGTLLFAVLPGLVAFVANLVVVYWTAGLGLFALARWLRVGPLAAGAAALTYAYGSMMVGQLIHLGVIQGQALLPWLVLSQLALGRALLGERDGGVAHLVRAAVPGTVALAVVVGLVCLTGEPRAMADAVTVALVVAVCELVAHGTTQVATLAGRVAFAVATLLGAAWGVALGAVQLLPGWAFVSVSERAVIGYHFFAAGSLSARWLSLLFVPGLLGTNGVLGTPQYFGSYNLPEVTMYAGLVSLVAVAAFAAQLLARRSRAPRRRLVAFLALVVVGAVLAIGPNTVLGPLLHSIPLLGRTRLQSRSLAVLDLGAAVLLAWWLDAVVARRRSEASLTGARLAVTVVPLALTVVLGTAALVAPATVTQSLLQDAGTASHAASVRPVVAGSLVLALALLALVVACGRARPSRAHVLLLGLAALDLLAFNVLFETGLVSGTPSVSPSRAASVAAFGTTGRHAIADPAVLDYHEVVPLGLANLDVLTGQRSVQGYGSLHAGAYADATGTHLLGRLDGCALARGVFTPLRLDAIAAAQNSLVTTPGTLGADDRCGRPRFAVRHVRYFGALEPVAWLAVTTSGTPPARLAVQLLGGRGQVVARAVAHPRGGVAVVAFSSHPVAAGVRLLAAHPFAIASTTLRAVRQRAVRLDTWLQVGLDGPTWRLAAVHGPLTYFRARTVRAGAWLEDDPRGQAQVVSSAQDGTTTVAVEATHRATLVVSAAYVPGWTATATSPGGTAHALAVRRDGLVQAVTVPPGRSTVTLAYGAPRFTEGLVASAVALAALLGALGWLARPRRRASPTVGHGTSQ